MSHRVKIRKNSLAENLYLDRQGCWVPWKQATWFNSDNAADQFAHRHGIDVFGLFPCESLNVQPLIQIGLLRLSDGNETTQRKGGDLLLPTYPGT